MESKFIGEKMLEFVQVQVTVAPHWDWPNSKQEESESKLSVKACLIFIVCQVNN